MKPLETSELTQFELTCALGTHAGMTGKNNEDSLAIFAYNVAALEDAPTRPLIIAIVADGVGGQSAGEFASQLAIETIDSYFSDLASISLDDVQAHLKASIQAANVAVYSESQSNPERYHMATTIVAVAILDGLLFSSHVGDSRLYIARDNHFLQATKDHSWIQEALEAGLITKEESRSHPNKNIIRRSLGSGPEAEIDQEMLYHSHSVFYPGMPLQPNDTLLLCSDGLNDMVGDFDIALTVKEKQDELEAGVEELINKANAAGGKDNISVILIHASASYHSNVNSPFDPPEEPPMPEDPKTTAFDSEEIDTVPNIPKVVSVPLDKVQRQNRARRRRFTLTLILTALIAIAIVVLLFYFGIIP